MLPMLLHRALPPPAGPPVTTNRHRVRFTRSGIQGYRQPLQSQSNPFGLTYFVSGRYLRIGRCKPIAAIPVVYKSLQSKTGRFFEKANRPGVGRVRTAKWAAYERSRGERLRRASRRFGSEACPRTKLEGAVESSACRENRRASAACRRNPKRPAMLHVTLPLSNLTPLPHDCGRAQKPDAGPAPPRAPKSHNQLPTFGRDPKIVALQHGSCDNGLWESAVGASDRIGEST